MTSSTDKHPAQNPALRPLVQVLREMAHRQRELGCYDDAGALQRAAMVAEPYDAEIARLRSRLAKARAIAIRNGDAEDSELVLALTEQPS